MLIAIVKGLLNPAVSNEWDAYDYLFMLGTPKILDEIKDKRHKAQSAVIQKRLERAKKSVEDGLKERHIILDSAQLSHPLDGLQSPVMRGIQ